MSEKAKHLFGEAALSPLRRMAGGSAGSLAPPREATGVSPPRWRLSIRPRRSAALPCGAATGGQPVLRGGVERRFLDAANCSGIEFREGKALGAKVFV